MNSPTLLASGARPATTAHRQDAPHRPRGAPRISSSKCRSSRLVGLGERLIRMHTPIVTPRMSCARRKARSFLSSRWNPVAQVVAGPGPRSG